jgi:hypothetical protein
VKVGAGIGQGDGVDAVLDFTAVAVVLTLHAGRVRAAFGRSCLIDHAQRLGVRMLGGHQLLAAVAEPLLVPPDGLQKSLERADGHALSQRERLDILALHVAEQPANVNRQQQPASGPAKAVGKQTQKLGQQFSKRCDILKRHGTTLRGFPRKQESHGGSFLSSLLVNGNKLPPHHDLATPTPTDVALSN